jgi:predicted O-methyltransferase YrrM
LGQHPAEMQSKRADLFHQPVSLPSPQLLARGWGRGPHRIAARAGRRDAGRAQRRGGGGRFDFAFLDADKENYDRYYEQCLKLVRPGGLIAIDNALWHGWVADPAHEDSDTAAIRALNRKVRNDPRVDVVLVPDRRRG